MWVRGLKRTLPSQNGTLTAVAPYVGAWIETVDAAVKSDNTFGRTLCGCVD